VRSIDDPFYSAIIDVLVQAREDAGLNQTELAQRLKRNQPFVSRYESRTFSLDVPQLREVCAALGLDWHDVNQSAHERLTGGAVSNPDKKPNVDFLASFPPNDEDWQEPDWHDFLQHLVEGGMLSWKEVAALTLGHLNPSQVGTSIASKKTFQAAFEKGKCWSAVRQWHFEQTGRCADCGTRLELQADHVETRADHGDHADRLDNLTLRCRRCNVIRRPSHKHGGKTHLTAEAALMWLLFTKKPRTYQEFEKLCRGYGMTMANIRFQEAWAMAHWLSRAGQYSIDADSKY
jgi:transcriptional regulator with XRE-family HTH domain